MTSWRTAVISVVLSLCDSSGAARLPEPAAEAAMLLAPIIGEGIGDDAEGAATAFWWAADSSSGLVVSICDDETDNDVEEAAAAAASDSSDVWCVALDCCVDCFIDKSVGAMDEARLRAMLPDDAEVGGGGGGDAAPKNCCWYCCWLRTAAAAAAAV